VPGGRFGVPDLKKAGFVRGTDAQTNEVLALDALPVVGPIWLPRGGASLSSIGTRRIR
jgi:hypothetical protein